MAEDQRGSTADAGAGAASANRSDVDAALEVVAERRRRVRRSVLVFVFVTVVIILLSVAERDHQARRGAIAACERRLLFARDELQRLLDERGLIAPAELPLPPVEVPAHPPIAGRSPEEDAYFEMRSQYVYNAFYGQAKDGSLVGVCYCAKPHQLYLQADGRHVLLFDGRTYQVRWIPEAEFQRRARQLGFSLVKGRQR